jgi:hypothetical protein
MAGLFSALAIERAKKAEARRPPENTRNEFLRDRGCKRLQMLRNAQILRYVPPTGGLLLTDIEIETSARKDPIKQRS